MRSATVDRPLMEQRRVIRPTRRGVWELKLEDPDRLIWA